MGGVKPSELKRTISYTETLSDIPVGETRSFEMKGAVYQGMYNAKSRLATTKGIIFQFETDAKNNLLIVKRIS